MLKNKFDGAYNMSVIQSKSDEKKKKKAYDDTLKWLKNLDIEKMRREIVAREEGSWAQKLLYADYEMYTQMEKVRDVINQSDIWGKDENGVYRDAKTATELLGYVPEVRNPLMFFKEEYREGLATQIENRQVTSENAEIYVSCVRAKAYDDTLKWLKNLDIEKMRRDVMLQEKGTPEQKLLYTDYTLYAQMEKVRDVINQSDIWGKDENGVYRDAKTATELLRYVPEVRNPLMFFKEEYREGLSTQMENRQVSPENAKIYAKLVSESDPVQNLPEDNSLPQQEDEGISSKPSQKSSEGKTLPQQKEREVSKMEKITVVRHQYGAKAEHEEALKHATKRNHRLRDAERETALQNLRRMEELGFIPKGPKGSSNAEVYLYRLHQCDLYYHLDEEIKMSDGSFQKIKDALGSESGKSHREVFDDLKKEKLSDDQLKDYARTINMAEGCITNKGTARTTHKIPIRGKMSFKAGISNDISVVEEQIVKETKDKSSQNASGNVSETLRNVTEEYGIEEQRESDSQSVAIQLSNRSNGMC